MSSSVCPSKSSAKVNTLRNTVRTHRCLVGLVFYVSFLFSLFSIFHVFLSISSSFFFLCLFLFLTLLYIPCLFLYLILYLCLVTQRNSFFPSPNPIFLRLHTIFFALSFSILSLWIFVVLFLSQIFILFLPFLF